MAASFSHLRQTNPALESFKLDEEIEGVKFRWYKTNKYVGNEYANSNFAYETIALDKFYKS